MAFATYKADGPSHPASEPLQGTNPSPVHHGYNLGASSWTTSSAPLAEDTEVLPTHTQASKVGAFGRMSDQAPHTIPSVDKLEEKRESARASRYASAIPVKGPPRSPLQLISGLSPSDTFFLAFYTLLSVITRLYRIGSNPHVVWDEAHFGKFGSYYLKREFYFDVHPPLGKILVGLAGLLSGYDGQFDFESGDAYPADLPYVRMRIIMAMYGILMVPVAYLTARCFQWNWRARHLFTLMVIFDNGWLTISRFMLLDSMLLLFTVCVVLGLVRFHRLQDHPFTKAWWAWLFFTGLSIGCVTSVKLVGLFATALVGLYTIEDLWNKFGDTKMPVRKYLRHWCARILALIVVPVLVYLLSFWMHFKILNHSGPGDAQMSSLFQAGLKGSDMERMPVEAAYGSRVTFKNMGYGGGLLHSHIQTYPEDSELGQVTCYHYKDENNEFILSPLWGEPPLPSENDTVATPPPMLKSGDLVRFHHAETGRNLHAHKEPAPITRDHYQVAGFGNETYGDSNDHWAIEVVDDLEGGTGGEGQPLRSLTSRLRFRHVNLGCYMRAANVVLPAWGWKQVEVTCDPDADPKDVFTYWNIENHWNKRLPPSDKRRFKTHFLSDVIHLNVAMMVSNNALVPDEDKYDVLASKPLEWPFIWSGLRMNGWDDDQDKYYLIGNPVIWWGSSISLGLMTALLVWYLLRRQRRVYDLGPRDWDEFLFMAKLGLGGWALHYGPFLLMGRVTYIHHYLPTLYFAVIVFVQLLDHFLWNDSTARYRQNLLSQLRRGQAGRTNALLQAGAAAPGHGKSLSPQNKNITFGVAVAAVLGVFLWFRGISFGMYGSIDSWWGLRWRKSWNIY